MKIAESNSLNPDNRLVNASVVAIVYTDKQGNIKQRSLLVGMQKNLSQHQLMRSL